MGEGHELWGVNAMYQPKDEIRGTYLTAYEAQLNAQLDKILRKRCHNQHIRRVIRTTRTLRTGVTVLMVKVG
jgi:hypothetical protein